MSESPSIRAAVLTGPNQLELRDFPRPKVDEGYCLVEVELCGICGTDLKYLNGDLAAPYPLVLGHEIVGRVAEIGPEAEQRFGVHQGERVIVESSIPCWTCPQCRSGAYRLCRTKGGYGTRTSSTVTPGLWGGMAQAVYVAPGSILHRIPKGLDARTAVATPLLANGIQWLQVHGTLGPGERLLIQGCGPQGLTAALVAKASGAAEVVVTGLTRDAARLAFAERIGATTLIVDGEGSDQALHGQEFDLVLDVSGSPAAVASAPDKLRPQGTLVLAGLVGRGTTVSFETDRLVWREIRIQAVLSKDERAIRSALALVQSDAQLRHLLGELVTHVFPLEQTRRALAAAGEGTEGFVKAAVAP